MPLTLNPVTFCDLEYLVVSFLPSTVNQRRTNLIFQGRCKEERRYVCRMPSIESTRSLQALLKCGGMAEPPRRLDGHGDLAVITSITDGRGRCPLKGCTPLPLLSVLDWRPPQSWVWASQWWERAWGEVSSVLHRFELLGEWSSPPASLSSFDTLGRKCLLEVLHMVGGRELTWWLQEMAV